MLTPYLECGKIINTHGCRGDLKVDPWTDSPEAFRELKRVFVGEAKVERRVLRTSVLQGRFILLVLEGVDSMDAAEALRNVTLYAAREDIQLEEGQYFLSDIIGVDVFDAREGREGQKLGVLKEILPGSSVPVYAIDTPNGQVLVPGVPAFVKDVVPGEYICIAPIAGMFDDDSEVVS